MKTRKFLAAGYEIRLRDYGIATVDRFCLVTDHLHRDRSRHARALKVSHRTPSQVMRHDARHADLAASCPPRSVEVFDRISLITEEDRPGNGTRGTARASAFDFWASRSARRGISLAWGSRSASSGRQPGRRRASRAAAGVLCGRSSGSAFGSPTLGPIGGRAHAWAGPAGSRACRPSRRTRASAGGPTPASKFGGAEREVPPPPPHNHAPAKTRLDPRRGYRESAARACVDCRASWARTATAERSLAGRKFSFRGEARGWHRRAARKPIAICARKCARDQLVSGSFQPRAATREK